MIRQVAVQFLPDYYSVLGVPQHSSPVGIRRAYLRKARLHHPDLNPREIEASSQMSVINEAYATLSDPDLRADYDAHRNTVILKVAPESLGQATVVQGAARGVEAESRGSSALQCWCSIASSTIWRLPSPSCSPRLRVA